MPPFITFRDIPLSSLSSLSSFPSPFILTLSNFSSVISSPFMPFHLLNVYSFATSSYHPFHLHLLTPYPSYSQTASFRSTAHHPVSLYFHRPTLPFSHFIPSTFTSSPFLSHTLQFLALNLPIMHLFALHPSPFIL